VPTTRLDGLVRRFSDQQTGSQKQRDLQKKDRVLRVRLNEDEYQLLKAFAESYGTTMSAMFRSFIRAIRQLDDQGKTITQTPATATEL
jgi:inactivated superfamily I helicase